MPASKPCLLDSVRAELNAAGRTNTALGQQALILAEKMSSAREGSGLASLSKELRETLIQAMRGASTKADPLDELKAKRDGKRRTAG